MFCRLPLAEAGAHPLVFANVADGPPSGMIEIKTAEEVRLSTAPKKRANEFEVVAKDRTVRLATADAGSLNKWMAALTKFVHDGAEHVEVFEAQVAGELGGEPLDPECIRRR
eukprot:SAG31_NODE_15835_length_736_cov_1.009419_2_plen_112_part_00